MGGLIRDSGRTLRNGSQQPGEADVGQRRSGANGVPYAQPIAAAGAALARNGRQHGHPAVSDFSQIPINGHHAKHFSVPFDAWPIALDSVLEEYCQRGRKGEQEAIRVLHHDHPELPKDLIWARIVYLRLTTSKRRPYQEHPWTPEDDEILRQGYAQGRNGAIRAIDTILERHPEWSRDVVAGRAKRLGLARCKGKPFRWNEQADEELLSLAGYRLETIEKLLKKSRKSILGRLAALGWGAEFFGGYKTKDLMADLNLSESAIRRLVRQGVLERVGNRITEESLIRLCREHPEEIPFETLSPCHQNWLVNSLHYGKKIRLQRGGRKKKDTPQTDD